MSSRFGGGAKCPKCGKTVYMAEEIVGAGSKWHKMCFKCTDCNKMLDRYQTEKLVGTSSMRHVLHSSALL